MHSEFPYYIRVHGQLFHSVPPAIAKPGERARFIQLYIIDNALEEIMADERNANLDSNTVEQILDYLTENNAWAIAIRRIVEENLKGKPDVQNVRIDFIPGDDHRHRLPRQDIIAGFVPNMPDEKINYHRSVKVSNANGKFTSINELHGMYDPAHYVIMFPKGEPGYARQGHKEKEDTPLKFYQQRIQIRPKRHVSMGHYGRLAHEYFIDQWLKVETDRLNYIKMNQTDLRGSTHPDERPDDAPVGNDEGRSIVYLPPSFNGGKRYYRRKFLDGVNVANIIGAGTVLVTMTANPNWPEIKAELEEGELPNDRPDIVALGW